MGHQRRGGGKGWGVGKLKKSKVVIYLCLIMPLAILVVPIAILKRVKD